MSGKYVHIKHSEKWGWWLAWGNETFYTDNRVMRTWDTAIEAGRWVQENHPRLTVVGADFVEPDETDTIEQLPLFATQEQQT